MARDCQECINSCCLRWCVEELLCAMDCCGCCDIPVLLVPDADIQAGTILAQRTGDLRFGPFDAFAVDGLQKPKGIARYHVKSDANGNVINRYISPLVPTNACGQLYTNMYICGIFRLQELIGDVQAAESAGLLRIVDGIAGGSGLVKLI